MHVLNSADGFDNRTALEEGWDLFDVDGRLQLQRLDCPADYASLLNYREPKFTCDAEALIHVALKAHQGSLYHYRALALIGTLVR